MKVLLAGATGAIGRPLLDRLLRDGHEVVATSRDAARAQELTARGAQGVVLDAFDADAVRRVVHDARPEVVVHQLTSLPAEPDPKAMQASVDLTTRLRRETVPVFTHAARDAGARRIVVQSISFVTRPAGPVVLDEDAPLYLDAPVGFADTVAGVRDMEHAATQTDGIEGVVLRYGFFYGPGTWNEREGAIGRMVAKRRFPVVGRGEGMYSYIHVDDAADATMAALDRGAPGIYNVCDDEPVMAREWIPVVARAMGAKKPFRVPVWLARRVAGDVAVHYATGLSGASNARAREQLGISPRPWREGLPAAFAA